MDKHALLLTSDVLPLLPLIKRIIIKLAVFRRAQRPPMVALFTSAPLSSHQPDTYAKNLSCPPVRSQKNKRIAPW